MVAVINSELAEQVAVRYPDLGRPHELAPLRYDFRVSNSLFLYNTSGGRFILKAMVHPQALYGQSDVVERLECVGRAVRELHAAGLPVEEIIPGREGRYVQQYHEHLLRLYAFAPGRPCADHDLDTRRSARSLRRLHQDGLRCLSQTTRQSLAHYERAYSFRSTGGQVPVLRAFVEEQSAASPAWAGILGQWDVIEWAVDRTLAHRSLLAEPACVVHTDFHPRNALFPDGLDEATMVDFDNMMIEPRLQCLGFSILRFAFFHGGRTAEGLRGAMEIFTQGECRNPAFVDDLVHAMIRVEIEKVLRIIHRVMATGQYAGFIDNIPPVHLANLAFLRASFDDD